MSIFNAAIAPFNRTRKAARSRRRIGAPWLLSVVALSCFLLPRLAQAADQTYWVTESGAGQRTGLSSANSWSVTDFNNPDRWSGTEDPARIDPGDTVVVSGTIQTRLKVKGSGLAGHPITIDGDDGAAPALVVATPPSVWVDDVHHVVVQDLAIDGNNTTPGSSAGGIRVMYGSSDILINHCDIQRTGTGIDVWGPSRDVRVTSCLIHDQPSSCIQLIGHAPGSDVRPAYVTIGGDPASGNTLRDCGKYAGGTHVASDIRGSSTDTVVSYNHMYASSPDNETGFSGLYFNPGRNLLVEHNTIHGHNTTHHRPGINVKADADMESRNVVIRFNHIYDERIDGRAYSSPDGATGIRISMDWKDVYVYGNYVHDCGQGIDINKGWQKENNSNGLHPARGYFWANIVEGIADKGIYVSGSGDDHMQDVFIFNNTIYRTTSMNVTTWPHAAVVINLANNYLKNLLFSNNIIVDSRLNIPPHHSIGARSGLGSLSLIKNLWYQSDQSAPSAFISENSACQPCTMASGNGEYFAQDSVDNPRFLGADTHDFRLSKDSPAVASGQPTKLAQATVVIQGVSYAMPLGALLDPAHTSWTVVPVVADVIQPLTNDSPDRGAYAYAPTCKEQHGECCASGQECVGSMSTITTDCSICCTAGGHCQNTRDAGPAIDAPTDVVHDAEGLETSTSTDGSTDADRDTPQAAQDSAGGCACSVRSPTQPWPTPLAFVLGWLVWYARKRRTPAAERGSAPRLGSTKAGRTHRSSL